MTISSSQQDSRSLVRQEIAAIAGYIPGEQPQDAGWTKLNTNENPYSPSANVSKAIAASCEGRSLAKYPDPFANEFRKQAANVLGVRPDMILCGNGSDDLLTILVRCYVGTGDAMRVPTPSYILYQTLADIQGVLCDKVAFTDEWLLPESFAAPNTSTGEPVSLQLFRIPTAHQARCSHQSNFLNLRNNCRVRLWSMRPTVISVRAIVLTWWTKATELL